MAAADFTPIPLPTLSPQRHRQITEWLARHYNDVDPPQAATWYLAEVLGWEPRNGSKEEAAHSAAASPPSEGANEESAQRPSTQPATAEGSQDSGEALVDQPTVRLSFIVTADFEDEAPLSTDAIKYYADKVRDALDYSDCGQADNFDVEPLAELARAK
jgi:hypothetical protein